MVIKQTNLALDTLPVVRYLPLRLRVHSRGEERDLLVVEGRDGFKLRVSGVGCMKLWKMLLWERPAMGLLV